MLRVLVASQVLNGAGLVAGVTVRAFPAQGMLGFTSLVGLPSAPFTGLAYARAAVVLADMAPTRYSWAAALRMAMTPVHMHGHGHGTAAFGLGIAIHIGAMYLPSPLTSSTTCVLDAFVSRRCAPAVAVGVRCPGGRRRRSPRGRRRLKG